MIADVLRAFQEIKQEGVVRDYLLFGSVAAMAHTRPFYTQDVDVAVAVTNDDEYMAVFRRLAQFGTIHGRSAVIGQTPVEVFPASISPVIADAFTSPLRRRVEGITVKVASAEHLMLEALRVNRPQDRARVHLLMDTVSPQKLSELFVRLDDDGTLRRRFESLGG